MQAFFLPSGKRFRQESVWSARWFSKRSSQARTRHFGREDGTDPRSVVFQILLIGLDAGIMAKMIELVLADAVDADAEIAENHLIENRADIVFAVHMSALGDHILGGLEEEAGLAVIIETGDRVAAEGPLLGSLDHQIVLVQLDIGPAGMNVVKDGGAAVEAALHEGLQDDLRIHGQHLVAVGDEERLFRIHMVDGQHAGAGGAHGVPFGIDDTGAGPEQLDDVIQVIGDGVSAADDDIAGIGGDILQSLHDILEDRLAADFLEPADILGGLLGLGGSSSRDGNDDIHGRTPPSSESKRAR